ncbi:MAG TPA: hypothetical protein DCM64_09810 [Gammaproteobacteria bacterium]|nr:hypothetical protein [Gammaproteobacteria bacterium]
MKFPKMKAWKSIERTFVDPILAGAVTIYLAPAQPTTLPQMNNCSSARAITIYTGSISLPRK